MRLEIPFVPPSLNKTLRMHWGKKLKLNRDWSLLIRSRMPELYLQPFVKMQCKITLHHSRFYDEDNAYGAVKPVVDGLKAWKLIRDDSRDYLDLTVEQAKCRRKEAHTVIELEAA